MVELFSLNPDNAATFPVYLIEIEYTMVSYSIYLR